MSLYLLKMQEVIKLDKSSYMVKDLIDTLKLLFKLWSQKTNNFFCSVNTCLGSNLSATIKKDKITWTESQKLDTVII